MKCMIYDVFEYKNNFANPEPPSQHFFKNVYILQNLIGSNSR
jgi:hypothetical protein